MPEYSDWNVGQFTVIPRHGHGDIKHYKICNIKQSVYFSSHDPWCIFILWKSKYIIPDVSMSMDVCLAGFSKQFGQKIVWKHRLPTGGSDPASPGKRRTREAVDDLIRLHLFSIRKHPGTPVVSNTGSVGRTFKNTTNLRTPIRCQMIQRMNITIVISPFILHQFVRKVPTITSSCCSLVSLIKS